MGKIKKNEQSISYKLVGSVTQEEKDEILSLFERKNGLIELFKILPEISVKGENPIYDKLVIDMGETSTKFQKWWTDKSIKYKWENIPGFDWEINFDTLEIFLRQNK